MLKISLLFKKFKKNNSRILRIKNAKFSGYFYMNTNILGDFQICISAPLNPFQRCVKDFLNGRNMVQL